MFRIFLAIFCLLQNLLLYSINAGEKKVVLITGASKGIGLAVAKKLAQDGYLVYGTLRGTSNPFIFSQAVKNSSGNLIPVRLDVTDSHSIFLAVQKILDETGKIDILINNACEVVIGTCETETLEEQIRVMDVNYFGVVRLLQAVLPHMRERNQGHVINMGSVCGFEPFPVVESYVASKFALEGLSESLAVYLDRWNIKVTVVEPAGVKTGVSFFSPMGSRFTDETLCFKRFCEEGLKAMQNSYESCQSPEEIAELIAKILKEEHPHLRYQTNAQSAEMAGRCFNDPTGDEALMSKKNRQGSLLKFLPPTQQDE